MITVKVELNSAVTHATTELARMYICNDGERSKVNPTLGDYNVHVCRKGYFDPPLEMNPSSPVAARAAREGRVLDYPRQSYNVWRLIARSVLAAFPEEQQRRPKVGEGSALNAQTMAGLQKLRLVASKMHPVVAQDEDIATAIQWLDAADLEP